jgi:hypothetical protein
LESATAVAAATYDASLGTLPQAQGFIYTGDNNPNGTNPSPFVSGGALQKVTTVGGQYWDAVDPGINFSQTAVIDVKLQITSSNFVPNGGDGSPRSGNYFCIQDNNANSYDIGLSNGGFLINQYLNAMVPFPLADGTYHTYRFLVVAGVASLSIDGRIVQSGVRPSPSSLGCEERGLNVRSTASMETISSRDGKC